MSSILITGLKPNLYYNALTVSPSEVFLNKIDLALYWYLCQCLAHGRQIA